MVSIDCQYLGQLMCRLRHGPSGSELETDAPTDNMGKGSRFSPTDLCATSLLSCMVTTMGIAANKHDFVLLDCDAIVQKVMTSVPTRRIAALPVEIRLHGTYTTKQLRILHAAAESCPVKESLSPAIEISITWHESAAID